MVIDSLGRSRVILLTRLFSAQVLDNEQRHSVIVPRNQPTLQDELKWHLTKLPKFIDAINDHRSAALKGEMHFIEYSAIVHNINDELPDSPDNVVGKLAAMLYKASFSSVVANFQHEVDEKRKDPDGAKDPRDLNEAYLERWKLLAGFLQVPRHCVWYI